ncbi:ctl-like protein [Anaeramoeba ignava]|uniref:Ctl-like protein n=1 Tax=Anaeramoeba ignava TaxID=1746090 RepID=A0A9Q0LD50_ANAIG|nr:ctl-like protein [Anaeramoeba ignava]
MKSSTTITNKDTDEAFDYEEDFHGPIDQRKCRDFFCLVLFIIFWIGMLIIMAVGFATGTPKRLYYPSDFRGNVCGMDNSKLVDKIKDQVDNINDLDFLTDLTEKTKCFFPAINPWREFCVSECPDQGDFTNALNDNCPGLEITPYMTSNDFNATYCAYDSISVLRRCIPDLTEDNEAENQAKIMKKILQQLLKLWEILFKVGGYFLLPVELLLYLLSFGYGF